MSPPLSNARLPALLVGAALTFSAGNVWGQAQPFEPVEEPRTWQVDVGGGIVHGFSPGGDTTKDANWTVWGSANYRQIVYANGLDGLGWNAILRDNLRAGLQIRPRFAAGDIEGSSLERPDLGADATVYAFTRLPGNVVVGGRIGHDITGDDAGLNYYASVAHQRVTRIGLLQLTGYVNGGDADRAARYFGVSPEHAPGSGYAIFKPGGGPSSTGAAALLAVPIGDRFGAGVFLNYEHRLGDVRDSPLLEESDVWRAGLIFVRRFSSGR